MDEELIAWRNRFPMYEYRFQDDCIALKLEQPKFGCHCELDSNQEPDGCVIDDGLPDDCVHAIELARNGKDKTSCKYWLPIKMRLTKMAT